MAHPRKGSDYQCVYLGNYRSQRLHRHIMEIHLGRKLLPTEIIHHKNHNPNDNAIENLEITTREEHARHHMKLR
jgi:hypothetical protein